MLTTQERAERAVKEASGPRPRLPARQLPPGWCFPLGEHPAWAWGVFLSRTLRIRPYWWREIDELIAARNPRR